MSRRRRFRVIWDEGSTPSPRVKGLLRAMVAREQGRLHESVDRIERGGALDMRVRQRPVEGPEDSGSSIGAEIHSIMTGETGVTIDEHWCTHELTPDGAPCVIDKIRRG